MNLSSLIGNKFSLNLVQGTVQADWFLHPEEKQLITSAKSPRYIADFCRGRESARRALIGLGISNPPPILRGSRGEPLWPDGVVGSISHSADKALAIVGFKADAFGVGIDIQDLSRHPKKEIVQHICTEEEQNWVKKQPELQNERLLRIFSAKESIFKAIYPICGIYFGFQDAQLTWNAEKSRFSGILCRDLAEPFLQGYPLETRSFFSDNMIFSLTVIQTAMN